MTITGSRITDLLHWHDDMAADHTVLFDAMTAHRDTAALIRQLQAEVQDAWQAGLDEGRAQGRVTMSTSAAIRQLGDLVVALRAARRALEWAAERLPEMSDAYDAVDHVLQLVYALAQQGGSADA